MRDMSAVITSTFAAWEGEPQLERDVFGTTDPNRIVALVDEFCRHHLGGGVGGYEFFATSVGSVHGLRFDNGRRVVIKAQRSSASVDHLAAVQQVQTQLVSSGFPAPSPLLGPTRIGHGVAVVETLVDRGA